MRIVLLSKRRMKVRLAIGYDHWCINPETYLEFSGKSSESEGCSHTKSYTFKGSRGTYHVPKHFVGKIIK